jgi:hypothetical protein
MEKEDNSPSYIPEYDSITDPEDGFNSSDLRMLEEGPTMRAVGLLGPATAGIDVCRQRSEPSQSSGPYSYLEPPGLICNKINKFLLIGKPVQSVQFAQSVESALWNILDGGLSCVPEHFVLERTSTFVGHCRASVISARISDCLRKRSIESHFNSAKAKAKCFTQQFVEFRIRLFSGKGEFTHGVIVEVQRRSGSAIYFRDEYLAIFDAAEGMHDDDRIHQVHPPKWSMGSLKQENNIPCEQSVSKSLEFTCDLLKKDRLDANLLGIQSLALLTDAEKSCVEAALVASKNILSKQSELGNIISALMQNGSVYHDEDHSLKHSDMFAQVRANALIVFCNALDACAKGGCLSQLIIHQTWYTKILVPFLAKELKMAEKSPLMALLSTRCLNILVECSVDCRSKALDMGVLEALEDAREFGRTRYASLVTETERGVSLLCIKQ